MGKTLEDKWKKLFCFKQVFYLECTNFMMLQFKQYSYIQFTSKIDLTKCTHFSSCLIDLCLFHVIIYIACIKTIINKV